MHHGIIRPTGTGSTYFRCPREAVLVALTVLNPDDDRRDPIRRGFDEHWVKPLEGADLLERIRRELGDAGAAAR